MAPAVDELLYARDGFRGGLRVQVESADGTVVAAFDPSKFTSIDPGCDVTLLRSLPLVLNC